MNQHTTITAMGGGLLGTLVQTLMVYGVIPMMTGSMDLAVLQERFCDVGMLANVFTGSIVFPLGYVALASHSFPGSPVVKGMLWAGLIWAISEFIMAPMLGAGVFSAELGGFTAASRALLGYLVYGATLGAAAAGMIVLETRHAAHALVPVRAR
jgi:hypothetical protein